MGIASVHAAPPSLPIRLLLDTNSPPAAVSTAFFRLGAVHIIEVRLVHLASREDSCVWTKVTVPICPTVAVTVTRGESPVAIYSQEAHAVEEVVVLDSKVLAMATPVGEMPVIKNVAWFGGRVACLSPCISRMITKWRQTLLFASLYQPGCRALSGAFKLHDEAGQFITQQHVGTLHELLPRCLLSRNFWTLVNTNRQTLFVSAPIPLVTWNSTAAAFVTSNLWGVCDGP